MKKILIFMGLAALVFIALQIFGTRTYSSITGIVIDAETGQPIEGAIVLVEWTKTHGIGEHWTESFKVEEVVTEKDGTFVLSGLKEHGVDRPDMTIYKQDYIAWNDKYIFPGYKKREYFHWKPGTIYNLTKFPAAYSHGDHYSFITTIARTAFAPGKKKQFRAAINGWEREQALKNR